MKIIIEYNNEVADHIHASRLYYSSGTFSKIDKVVAVLLAAAGVISALTPGIHWYAPFFFALAPLEWFNLLSLQPLRVRLMFKLEPKFRERYHLEFDESGVYFKTESIDSHIEWSFYERTMESKRVFLLIYGKMQYSVIPKSAFASDEEIAAFRDMLKRHVSAR